MPLPAWALVLLVGIPLVQIPLVLYLSRWFEIDGDAPVPTATRTFWTDGQGGEFGREGVRSVPGRCGRCGALNDPAFDFCGSCVTPL